MKKASQICLALAGIILAALVIKMSFIGYFTREIPLLAVLTAIFFALSIIGAILKRLVAEQEKRDAAQLLLERHHSRR